tara:strand:- start:36308 stop:36850 length:543 start_codon:yes stop_codon:yes gene_type:complete
MILPIQIHGSNVLREIAEEVDIKNRPEVDEFVDDLIETLRTTKTGVGIAAPQVGKPIRLFILWADRHLGKEPQVFINPEIVTFKGSKKMGQEGCLSVPGVYARVERFQKVRIKYLDKDWQPQEKLIKGFESVVIQHEYDHLNGLEFFDHLSSKEFEKIKRKLDELEDGNIPKLEYEYALE